MSRMITTCHTDIGDVRLGDIIKLTPILGDLIKDFHGDFGNFLLASTLQAAMKRYAANHNHCSVVRPHT